MYNKVHFLRWKGMWVQGMQVLYPVIAFHVSQSRDGATIA